MKYMGIDLQICCICMAALLSFKSELKFEILKLPGNGENV